MSNAATEELETDTNSERRVFVDARCLGCDSVKVRKVPANETWRKPHEDRDGTCTFHKTCTRCQEEQPHNILRFLRGVNKRHDDAVTISKLRND